MTYPDAGAVAQIGATPTTRVGPATVTAVRKRGELSWSAVTTGPVELHKASGLERELYALARSVASEAPPGGAAQLSVAECLRWEAKRRGKDCYQLLTFGTSSAYAWTAGQYGEQKGRHASTSRDPTARSLAAARASASSNLTGGAGRWFAPRVQDRGRQGTATLKDAATIARSWGAQGWRWIGPLPGVDSYAHAVLRQGDKTENAELVALIELGRAGKPTIGSSSPDLATAAVAAHGAPWWLLAAGGAAVLLSRA